MLRTLSRQHHTVPYDERPDLRAWPRDCSSWTSQRNVLCVFDTVAKRGDNLRAELDPWTYQSCRSLKKYLVSTITWYCVTVLLGHVFQQPSLHVPRYQIPNTKVSDRCLIDVDLIVFTVMRLQHVSDVLHVVKSLWPVRRSGTHCWNLPNLQMCCRDLT